MLRHCNKSIAKSAGNDCVDGAITISVDASRSLSHCLLGEWPILLGLSAKKGNTGARGRPRGQSAEGFTVLLPSVSKSDWKLRLCCNHGPCALLYLFRCAITVRTVAGALMGGSKTKRTQLGLTHAELET